MEYDTSNDYDTPDSDDPEHMLISLTKWKAGQVGCSRREHCEARLRICREGKKMDQEELWKLNKMNARKRCAPLPFAESAMGVVWSIVYHPPRLKNWSKKYLTIKIKNVPGTFKTKHYRYW